MKHYDVIIIGAGASGCMCALTAAKSGKSILIIDKLARAGKKLMATGNGRCNLTNHNIFPSEKFYNKNINKYLNRFNNNETISFFMNMGLLVYSDNEERIYPFSNTAKSVIDVINNQLNKYPNITLSLENEVQNIENINNIFKINSSKGNFSCNKLVIATGGKSAENFFEKLNLSSKPFIPSLVALKTESTRALDGIKVSDVKIEATCEGKTYIEIGEVLFKDSGISGIVSFNASTLFARQNKFNGNIKIDLLPTFKFDGVKNLLRERRQINVKIKNLFDGMFVSQLGFYILNKAKIENEERNSFSLTEEEIEKLAFAIKNINLKVKGHYDNNQVHSGGIALEDLTDNLESKKYKNLFFCGEVCDVDGICGGYNLQWAWTSGHIVGENL